MADSLSITDSRTGEMYEVPIFAGTFPDRGSAINASELRRIRASEEDFGLLAHDPGFLNTSSCRSRITFIDGDAGILRYRGYSIEQLAANSTYLEVAYLRNQRGTAHRVPTRSVDLRHNPPHDNQREDQAIPRRFPLQRSSDGHSCQRRCRAFYLLSQVSDVHDQSVRSRSIMRLIAKMPTLAAFAYRYNAGQPYSYPDNDLSYSGNFLNMMFKATELKYRPDPVLERALDVLFVLHADHEQNCSTSAMRNVGSSDADPYVSVSAAVAALYGPLHGGANEAVLRMLTEIGDVRNVPEYIRRVKSREFRLMGFGHRVYKSYDPRAKILRELAEQVFEVCGRNPLIEVATELEKIALEDEFFVERGLYPNVDFYSGIIYQAMGFPISMFPVLFAIPRTSGWLAHWEEMRNDPELRIARPRQVYSGEAERSYVPLAERA